MTARELDALEGLGDMLRQNGRTPPLPPPTTIEQERAREALGE